MSYIDAPMFDRGSKESSAVLLVLSLLETRPRHGYEMRELIEMRSDGTPGFNAASLLYRLEMRGWIEGRWVERAGGRRRRYYKLTIEGKNALAAQSAI